MLQNNKFSQELLECYGWEEVLSKNPIMYSYKHADSGTRLNHYFTNGTVTAQTPNGKYTSWRDIHDDNQIEDILCKMKN